jgi:hypothetical protein
MEAKPALLLPAHLGVSSLNWGAPSLVRPVFSGGDAQANGSGRHPPPRRPDACPAADGSVKRANASR